MKPWTPEEFTEQLREVGRKHYHDKHPFHKLMNDGKLTREQLKVWVGNRFYYQKMIPVKDAYFLSKCPVREIRRRWIQRILDHDGHGDDSGGIEKWLRLGEGIGVSREVMENDGMLLPGVRFAVDAYVNFVRTQPWVQAAASSLTELFAPKLMATRIEAFEKHYTWIDKEALAYMRGRLTQAPRDSEHGLEIVHKYCTTREQQEETIRTLQFKCNVLWEQLDATYFYCVSPTRTDAP